MYFFDGFEIEQVQCNDVVVELVDSCFVLFGFFGCEFVVQVLVLGVGCGVQVDYYLVWLDEFEFFVDFFEFVGCV